VYLSALGWRVIKKKKKTPQAAPPWGRSYQLLSAGRLITADNTDMPHLVPLQNVKPGEVEA